MFFTASLSGWTVVLKTMWSLLKPASYTASVMSPTFGDIDYALHNPNHLDSIEIPAVMMCRTIEHEWIKHQTKAFIDFLVSTPFVTINLMNYNMLRLLVSHLPYLVHMNNCLLLIPRHIISWLFTIWYDDGPLTVLVSKKYTGQFHVSFSLVIKLFEKLNFRDYFFKTFQLMLCHHCT